MSLVNYTRIKESVPGFLAEEGKVLAHIQQSSEALIEKVCGRKFAAANYDELYHGTGNHFLLLNQRPIITVSAVRYGLLPAIYVLNNSQSNYQSTIAVTSTGVTLTRFSNAQQFATDLDYEDYPTITQLAAAINSLGNGWVATVGGEPFSGWASADLAAFQGSFGTSFRTANLLIHRWYLENYRINNNVGEISSSQGFPNGYQHYRVSYRAGYETIPDDLQEAICELVRTTYQRLKVNNNLASESLGSYSYSVATQQSFESMSAAFKQTIGLYRSYDLGRWR